MGISSYKFKCYKQSKQHEHKLSKLLELNCEVYNHVIAVKEHYHALYHRSVQRFDLIRHFIKIKHRCYKNWEVLYKGTIDSIIDRVCAEYTLFFRHINKRPPMFKSVSRYSTISFKQTGWILKDNTFTIRRQNLKIRFFKSREINGEIKLVILKKDKVGDWWINFIVSNDNVKYAFKGMTGKHVGLDFGLKHFLTLSDGTCIKGLEPLKRSIKKLKNHCRKLSKKTLYSNNYRRARLSLNRLYKRIANQRTNFHWETAKFLVTHYDIICVENLDLKSMCKTYGRKVQDLGYFSFLKILKWMCVKYGKEFIQINRFEPSTKTCSVCGHVESFIPLRSRQWICSKCGTILDRDINAARNILRVGVSTLNSGNISSVMQTVSNTVKI